MKISYMSLGVSAALTGLVIGQNIKVPIPEGWLLLSAVCFIGSIIAYYNGE